MIMPVMPFHLAITSALQQPQSAAKRPEPRRDGGGGAGRTANGHGGDDDGDARARDRSRDPPTRCVGARVASRRLWADAQCGPFAHTRARGVLRDAPAAHRVVVPAVPASCTGRSPASARHRWRRTSRRPRAGPAPGSATSSARCARSSSRRGSASRCPRSAGGSSTSSASTARCRTAAGTAACARTSSGARCAARSTWTSRGRRAPPTS